MWAHYLEVYLSERDAVVDLIAYELYFALLANVA